MKWKFSFALENENRFSLYGEVGMLFRHDQIISYQYQIESNQIRSTHININIRSSQIRSNQIKSDQIKSNLALHEHMKLNNGESSFIWFYSQRKRTKIVDRKLLRKGFKRFLKGSRVPRDFWSLYSRDLKNLLEVIQTFSIFVYFLFQLTYQSRTQVLTLQCFSIFNK